jgi:hypothetical protein
MEGGQMVRLAEGGEEEVARVKWVEGWVSSWSESVVSRSARAVVVVMEAECVSAFRIQRCCLFGQMGKVHDLQGRTAGPD